MAKSLAVLAFSGGLDTTVILHWLRANGWDVATYTANLGQPGADLEAAAAKASQIPSPSPWDDDTSGEHPGGEHPGGHSDGSDDGSVVVTIVSRAWKAPMSSL